LVHAFRLLKDIKDDIGLMLLYFKVESDIEKVEISNEHLNYKWVSPFEIDNLINDKRISIEKGHIEALRLALE